MQKITPHLWFDKEAREAAGFYTSVFPDARIKDTITLSNTPSGAVDIVTATFLQMKKFDIAALQRAFEGA
jgi:predicted 3-demethylubiquinone-9 3-methyltransferase (glyoxalase superfamily)